MTTRLRSICAQCGTPYTRDGDRSVATSLCDQCSGPRRKRGYDWAWRKLSEKARRLQPFCTDCGTTRNLTVDHTPEAWRRRDAGKPIRLQDVDVVCDVCNALRGAARGDGAKHRCPVCRRPIAPTVERTVERHATGVGSDCPMSGQPFKAVHA